MNKLTARDFLFVYDKQAVQDMGGLGFKFIMAARHEKTGNKFFLYERSPELAKALYNRSK